MREFFCGKFNLQAADLNLRKIAREFGEIPPALFDTPIPHPVLTCVPRNNHYNTKDYTKLSFNSYLVRYLCQGSLGAIQAFRTKGLARYIKLFMMLIKGASMSAAGLGFEPR